MSYQLAPWKCKYFSGLLEILTFHDFILIVQDVCFFLQYQFHFLLYIRNFCFSTCVHDLNFTPSLLHQFLSSPSNLVFGPPTLTEILPPRLTPPTAPLVHSYFSMPTSLLKVLHKILKVLHKVSHKTDFFRSYSNTNKQALKLGSEIMFLYK